MDTAVFKILILVISGFEYSFELKLSPYIISRCPELEAPIHVYIWEAVVAKPEGWKTQNGRIILPKPR